MRSSTQRALLVPAENGWPRPVRKRTVSCLSTCLRRLRRGRQRKCGGFIWWWITSRSINHGRRSALLAERPWLKLLWQPRTVRRLIRSSVSLGKCIITAHVIISTRNQASWYRRWRHTLEGVTAGAGHCLVCTMRRRLLKLWQSWYTSPASLLLPKCTAVVWFDLGILISNLMNNALLD